MRASKSKQERSELQHQKEQQEHQQQHQHQLTLQHQQQQQQQRRHQQKQQLPRSLNSSLDSTRTNGRSSTMLPVEEQKSAAITTASTISDSQLNSQSPISSSTSSSQQPSKSRLVFGLNERTNKLKHDEYAEKRIANSSVANRDYLKSEQPSSSKGSKQSLSDQSAKTTNKDSNRSTNVTQVESMNESGRTKIVSNDKIREKEQSISDNENKKAPLELHQKPQQQAGAKIRASKYGNFYKPQDLLSTTAATSLPQKSKSQSIVGSPPLSGETGPDLSKQESNNKREQPPKVSREASTDPKRRNSTGKSPDVSSSNGQQTPVSKKSLSHSLSSESIEAKFFDKTPSTSPAAISKSTSTENNSKSVGKSSSIKEKKVERDSPSTYSSIITEAKTKIEPPATVATTVATNQQAPEAPLQKASKMQFNIPPPPQVSSSSSKSSVVSYAKSRIYNKQPTKQQQQHQFGQISLTGQHSLLNSGTIPESILSGFKPPKQVNVSKAREKWEGGEPFAKSKSRQRLAAAQVGNKFPHGIWSITSVVATQQMQFQQALANSSSSTARSNAIRDGLSVKILTRGSVLERVQQFEKAPGVTSSSSTSSSISPTSSTSSISSSGSDCSISDDLNDLNSGNLIGTNDVEASITIGASLSSRSEQSNSKQIVSEQKQLSSKQAQYKSRVSSIQSGLNEPLTKLITSSNNNNNSSPPSSPLSSLTSPPNQGRRFSLTRRRSSSLVRGNSSSSIIPRFYHPNGKPNTYEIELQKKNIVACFDKFPDRNALLTSPIYKRHFHAIALACNFSEYFKEPLFLYIKHQMTQSNLLHNTSNSAAVRKTSGINLISMTDGTPNQQQQQQQQQKSTANVANINERSTISKSTTGIKTPTTPTSSRYSSTKNPLTRAASIDTSTMEKLQNQAYITCDQFLICWRNIINSCFDNASRFVHLLTFGQRNYLIPDDFVPLIQSIIDDHPGLKFLRAAPDFHMRYIQTVIARIYFSINKSWTGKISLNELRNSNLLAVLQVLSQEEDINQITDYFSYEHFYVIYCKFWSLDQDHDLLISKEDLARHNDASISSRIIERIFSGIVSKQIQQTGKMSYSDFVWFLIAEEDKKHPRSIEYWFRLMDIDGDGYVSMYEMEYFYYEQMKRLELMNIEALPFIDSACQILDLVNPKEKNKISLSDLKRTKMATIFFDTFINLEKYLEHESREFVSTRDIVQDGVVISDWDRYASEEYESLVSEETSV